MAGTMMVLIALLTAPLVVSTGRLSGDSLIYPLCVCLAFVSIWIVCTLHHVSIDLFNIYSLFVIAAFFFNGGHAFLEVLHLNEYGILQDRFSVETITAVLYMVSLAMVSFHLGGLWGGWRRRPANEADRERHELSEAAEQALRATGYLLLAVSLIPTMIVTLASLKVVFLGGYFALYEQQRLAGLEAGVVPVIQNLAGFFVPGGLFLFTGNRRRHLSRNVIAFLLLFYFLALMVIGHRRYGTMILLACLWVWHKTAKPIPRCWLMGIGVFLLAVAFPVVKLMRDVDGPKRVSLQYIADSYLSANNPVVMAISEMGESMRTVAYTYELVPDVRPYARGSTYLFAMSSVVPNLFWKLHPSVEYGNLGRWLTMTVRADSGLGGGGFGYSFIAEAYANFGWFGIVVLLGLFGFGLARLANWPDSGGDDSRVVVVAVCMSTMLLWTRGDTTAFFRPMVYYAIIPYFIFHYFRKRIVRFADKPSVFSAETKSD